MYLAVKWSVSDEQSLQILTPRVMKWQDDVWLMDLRVCLPYWRFLAQRRNCPLGDLLRDLLQQQMPSKGYLAVLAESPWQAVLLMNYLSDRKLEGFVDRNSNFGSGLYRDISWHTWWKTAAQWGDHAERLKIKKFNLSVFKRNLHQMQRAVENVGATCPWAMQNINSVAMRRRYGQFIKMMWEWSFPQPRCSLMDEGFVWDNYKAAELVKLKRWLEEPLYDWDHLSPFLRDDLDKLCTLESFTERQKLVCLEWRLTLHDATTLLVPIRFRHPHSLHREVQSQGTALLQANYAFQDCMQAKQKECLEQTDSYAPPIVGWELVVKEQLTLPPKMLDLFGDGEEDEAALLRLENRLPVRLYHFDLKNDWSPEESYAVYGQDTSAIEDPARHSLTAVAKRRPLFLYQRSMPLERQQARSSLWQFTERTMSKWWQERSSSSGGDLAKDYYRYVDERHRSLWVAKGESNQWYVHGIFA